MEYTILICEDSIEGVFTGIYEAYARHLSSADTFLQIGEEAELRLFSEYITVQAEKSKAEKVSRTLREVMGEMDLGQIYLALASEDSEKSQAVYQVVVQALADRKRAGSVLDNLANQYVRKIFELARGVNNEILHLHGFLRFGELENGIMYAKIGPKNNIVSLLMPHFADRFPFEDFIIYDDKRKLFGVHPKGEKWYMIKDAQLPENLVYSQAEKNYQELFRYFCHKISIEARKNPKLQQNMLPLRFQEYMVEFGKSDQNVV